MRAFYDEWLPTVKIKPVEEGAVHSSRTQCQHAPQINNETNLNIEGNVEGTAESTRGDGGDDESTSHHNETDQQSDVGRLPSNESDDTRNSIAIDRAPPRKTHQNVHEEKVKPQSKSEKTMHASKGSSALFLSDFLLIYRWRRLRIGDV